MDTWENFYADEKKKDYMTKLMNFINNEYNTKVIYPPKDKIFNAIKTTSFEDTKVVILGQDPYHGPNQAHGLSFSIKSKEAKVAPSLINIFKELENDLGIKRSETNLTNWAKQGVLLLNTVLTVEENKAGSHRNKGWEIFTTEIIKKLNDKKTPVMFVLWGADARSKKVLIKNKSHEIIESVHPSPLSAYRGFFNSKPFSKINVFLEKNNYSEIKWN